MQLILACSKKTLSSCQRHTSPLLLLQSLSLLLSPFFHHSMRALRAKHEHSINSATLSIRSHPTLFPFVHPSVRRSARFVRSAQIRPNSHRSCWRTCPRMRSSVRPPKSRPASRATRRAKSSRANWPVARQPATRGRHNNRPSTSDYDERVTMSYVLCRHASSWRVPVEINKPPFIGQQQQQ